MKHTHILIISIFLTTSFFFYSCNNSDSHIKEIIKADILKKAMNNDVNPIFDSISVRGVYSVKQITDFWIAKELKGKGSIDSLITLFSGVDKTKGEDQYLFYKWQLSRFKYLKTLNPDDELYRIVKVNYVIDNPLLKMKVKLVKYYVLSSDKVLTSISEDSFEEALRRDSEIPYLFIYEYAIFMDEKPKLP